MHWAVILTMLGLALANAWLVLVEGWTFMDASLIVSASAIGILVMLFAGVLAITPKEDWADVMQVVRDTMRQDFKDIIRWIRMDR